MMIKKPQRYQYGFSEWRKKEEEVSERKKGSAAEFKFKFFQQKVLWHLDSISNEKGLGFKLV